jgi:hypothetical protein
MQGKAAKRVEGGKHQRHASTGNVQKVNKSKENQKLKCEVKALQKALASLASIGGSSTFNIGRSNSSSQKKQQRGRK